MKRVSRMLIGAAVLVPALMICARHVPFVPLPAAGDALFPLVAAALALLCMASLLPRLRRAAAWRSDIDDPWLRADALIRWTCVMAGAFGLAAVAGCAAAWSVAVVVGDGLTGANARSFTVAGSARVACSRKAPQCLLDTSGLLTKRRLFADVPVPGSAMAAEGPVRVRVEGRRSAWGIHVDHLVFEPPAR